MPRRAVALEETLEAPHHRPLDLRPPLEPAQEQRRGFDGGEGIAPWLAAELAVARVSARAQHDAPAFQHPRLAPPKRLRLAPAAVEEDDALDLRERRVLIARGLCLAVEHDDLAAGAELGGARRAQIEHRPALGIGRTGERLAEARPGEADLEARLLQMKGGEPRRPERHVLLLRML